MLYLRSWQFYQFFFFFSSSKYCSSAKHSFILLESLGRGNDSKLRLTCQFHLVTNCFEILYTPYRNDTMFLTSSNIKRVDDSQHKLFSSHNNTSYIANEQLYNYGQIILGGKISRAIYAFQYGHPLTPSDTHRLNWFRIRNVRLFFLNANFTISLCTATVRWETFPFCQLFLCECAGCILWNECVYKNITCIILTIMLSYIFKGECVWISETWFADVKYCLSYRRNHLQVSWIFHVN